MVFLKHAPEKNYCLKLYKHPPLFEHSRLCTGCSLLPPVFGTHLIHCFFRDPCPDFFDQCNPLYCNTVWSVIFEGEYMVTVTTQCILVLCLQARWMFTMCTVTAGPGFEAKFLLP